MISLALRSGIPLSAIHKQLRGISSDRAVGLGPNKVLSLPDAIGIAIEEWHRDRVIGVQQELLPPAVDARGPSSNGASGGGMSPEMVTSMTHQVPASVRGSGSAGAEMELQFGLHHAAEAFIGTCPDCGSQMEYAEGCVKCHVCGFSECG
jgi:ribonucleoside-diphosphate reductase alpha chain